MDPTNPPRSDFSLLVSTVIYLFSISVLSYILTVRCRIQLLWDIVRGRETWARICAVTVFVLSWLFIFASAVHVLGIGLQGNVDACWVLLMLCITLYGSTKVFVYCFLIEKVYLVWTAGSASGRFQSTLWRLCMCGLFVYIGIFVLMFLGRMVRMNEEAECMVGFSLTSAATTVAFDMTLTLVMTFLFVYPLRKNAGMNARLRKTATRALIAAIASLSSSSVSSSFLGYSSGIFGWMCLVLCAGDVTINALAIYFVTYGSDSTSTTTPDQHNLSSLIIPTMGQGVLTQLSIADGYDPGKYSTKDPAHRNSTIHEPTKPEYWTNSDTVQEISSPVRIILPTSPNQSIFSSAPSYTLASATGNLESRSTSLEAGSGSRPEAEGNVSRDLDMGVPLHR